MDIKKIKFDDFVSKVNDISKDPQQKIALSGYVGESPNKGCIRIYHDASLSNYSEVNADDVIHQEQHQNATLGGSVIWIKADAKISHGNDAYHYDAKKDYFQGEITTGQATTQACPGPVTTKTCTYTDVWRPTSRTCHDTDFILPTSRTCTELVMPTTTIACPRPTTKTCTFPPPDLRPVTTKTCPIPTTSYTCTDYYYRGGTGPEPTNYFGTGGYNPYEGF